jgi:hypothetical protein
MRNISNEQKDVEDEYSIFYDEYFFPEESITIKTLLVSNKRESVPFCVC